MVRLIQSSDADITIGGHLSSAFLYSSTTFSRILADRIAPRGSADAAQGDAFNDFDNWEENDFWPAMTKKYAGTADVETNEPGVTIQISSQRRSSLLRHDVQEASVVPTETLTSADVPAKRHIEISLPPDMTCRTGDYLAILPLNQQESVQRVMRHFGLAKDAALIITSKGETTLPTSISISAVVVFTAHVELVQPVTKWVTITQSLLKSENLLTASEYHGPCESHRRREDQKTASPPSLRVCSGWNGISKILRWRTARTLLTNLNISRLVHRHATSTAYPPVLHLIFPPQETRHIHPNLRRPRRRSVLGNRLLQRCRL